MARVYWLSQRQSDVPAGSLWLSEAERAREAALRFAKRREDWRLGRWTAKRALVTLRGSPDSRAPEDGAGLESLARAEVRPAPSGAPELFWDGAPSPWALSISHSGDRSLVALAPAGTALGCDVERIEPRSPAFLEDSFTPEEREAIDGALEPEAVATLFWSAKESALKALGQGLRLPLQGLAVRAVPAGRDWQALDVLERSCRRSWSGYGRREDGWVLTLVASPAPEALVELGGGRGESRLVRPARAAQTWGRRSAATDPGLR